MKNKGMKKIRAAAVSLIVAAAVMPCAVSAADTVIGSVSVYYEQPAAGQIMQIPEVVPADAGYEVSAFTVTALTGSGTPSYSMEQMEGADIYYKKSMPYYYKVTLKAKDGYRFRTDVVKDGIISTSYLKADSVYGGGASVTSKKLTFETKSFLSTYSISVSEPSYVYTGKPIRPAAAISGNGKGYYTLSAVYISNTAVGTAKVTAQATGKRAGETAAEPYTTFAIVPKKASVSSLTPGTKKLTVKMGSAVSDTGGSTYRIYYRAKGTESWKSTTTTASSKTISGLTKGKTYQVKVQAYKGSFRGSWSDIKTSGKIK